MGYNTVAVLYNDHSQEIRKDGPLGERIARAMQSYTIRDRNPLALWFGVGQVVSQAHANYDQVVIVGQNSGRPVQDANDVSHLALLAMAECLIRHGWTARPPARKKRSTQ